MNKIVNKLKIFAEWFVEWFVFITAGILIICAVNFLLFSGGEDLPGDTLGHILLAAFLTAAETAVFFMAEPEKKSSMILWFVLHFGCLTLTMLVCGIRFGWIDASVFGMTEMVVSVAGVYAFAMVVYYILDIHRAEQINRRLREKYQEEEEE